MTEPVLSDPFDRWWANQPHKRDAAPVSAETAAARAAARDAWNAAHERSDGDGEVAPSTDERQSPLITEPESYALHLGSRALAEVAVGLMRSGQPELAAESARSAEALDRLQRRATVEAARDQVAEQEAQR